MKILYFKEGVQIHKADMISKLRIETAYEVLDKMERAKILKHYIPKEDLNGRTAGQEYYVFRYVGVITLKNITFIIYPKYINDIFKDINMGYKKFKQILKVIDKFQTVSIFASGQELMIDNSLSIQIKIMNDFLEYGLYYNMNYIDQVNGEGAANWERTVNESQAYIVDGTPYYLDIFTQKSTLDETNIIRRFHKIILTQIGQDIKPILSIIGMPELKFTDEELEDFGNLDYIESLFEQEISRQYVDDKRMVLKNLLEYIKTVSQVDLNYKNNSIKFYGTTAFNLVWEDVCKKVYEDNLRDKLSSLDLILEDSKKDVDYSKRDLLMDVVEKPLWNNLLEDNEVSAHNTYELDILNINHNQKSFNLYDSKYYKIEFTNDTVTGQPGIADITKQFFYEFAYKRLADMNGYDINNYFVVPYDELSDDTGQGLEIAQIKIDIFNLTDTNGIVVVARDSGLIYNEYLLK